MERDAEALLSGEDLTSYALRRCHDQLRMVLSLGRELEVPVALGERVTELCPRLAAVRRPRRGAPRRATHRRTRARRFHRKTAHHELLIEARVNVLMLIRCAPGMCFRAPSAFYRVERLVRPEVPSGRG